MACRHSAAQEVVDGTAVLQLVLNEHQTLECHFLHQPQFEAEGIGLDIDTAVSPDIVVVSCEINAFAPFRV